MESLNGAPKNGRVRLALLPFSPGVFVDLV
jgi:hypothetical protein